MVAEPESGIMAQGGKYFEQIGEVDLLIAGEILRPWWDAVPLCMDTIRL